MLHSSPPQAAGFPACRNMTDSNQDTSSATDQSSTQSEATNTDTAETDSKYVLGESPITRIGESLQTAATVTDGPLTREAYETWRNQDTDSHASAKQIVMHSDRGDTWGEICNSYDIMIGHTHDYDKETVLEALRSAATDIGEPLTQAQYNEWQQSQNKNLPTPHLIWKHFDNGWRELCEEAGVEPHTPQKYTPDDIKTALKDAATDLGEPLTLGSYRLWARNQSADRPGTQTIKRHFDDWITACMESDVEPHRLAQYTPSNPYPTEELFTAIQTAAEAKGEPLSPEEYNEWSQSHPDRPSKRTCLRRFDSWTAACKKAGVTSSSKK